MLETTTGILINVFQWGTLLAMLTGVTIGIIIGALPGLGATMGVALILPFTFSMEPSSGLLLLIGVYCGAVYGGSISAVLIGSPGTAASAATVLDGFALAKQGKADTALKLSLYASVAGALISGVFLLTASPFIAKFALRFGSPEFFMLALFGLTIIASVSGKSIIKGLIMAVSGLLITTIGIDVISGEKRFTFGSIDLLSGIDFVPAIIGLFAISEIFRQIEANAKSISNEQNIQKNKLRMRDIFPFRKTILKSGTIGTIIGVIPGAGPTISAYISYSEAKRVSKKPEEFGKGSEEGVVASESANNGTTGATLIPMLTLGIPGDSVTAILLGAFLIHGISPGPQLFTDHSNLVYTLMVGFIVVNVIMLFVGRVVIRYFSGITNMPSTILTPVILILCLMGTYALNNSMFNVFVAIIFGIIGYILQKFEYPVTSMLLGIVLGAMVETELRRSLLMSDGSMMIFFTRPISLVFFILVLLSIFVPLIQKRLLKKKKVIS